MMHICIYLWQLRAEDEVGDVMMSDGLTPRDTLGLLLDGELWYQMMYILYTLTDLITYNLCICRG